MAPLAPSLAISHWSLVIGGAFGAVISVLVYWYIGSVAQQRQPKFSILNSQFSIKNRFLIPHSSFLILSDKESQ